MSKRQKKALGEIDRKIEKLTQCEEGMRVDLSHLKRHFTDKRAEEAQRIGKKAGVK